MKLFFLFFILIAANLAIKNVTKVIWCVFLIISLALYSYYGQNYIALMFMWPALVAWIILAFHMPARRIFMAKAFLILQKMMPKISETEEQILKSGDVSFEGEFLTGNPNWKNLYKQPANQLSEEEKTFIEGPVKDLSRMIDDWEISQNKDLSQEIWDKIKNDGFLGLHIPTTYGGKAFSAWAHAQILLRLSARSPTVGVTVAVPNSLGPGELLLKYGTAEQKSHYLPRLAKGQEIPCFALTGPYAGSDASSIPDRGTVCKSSFKGEDTLGIRLNFDKRYITLAPVATLIGLAFQLYDPDGLLGGASSLGITLALLPRELEGIDIGKRHYPMYTPFQNGPIRGKDVFIPLDYIIGGPDNIGKGWLMLMECLGVGRAISIPSLGVSGAHLAMGSSSAYAAVREQFNRPIADFEGIQVPLARIAMQTYIVDSIHRFVISSVDQGVKPSIASAIVKSQCTQRGRDIANDAMDIHGGKAICLGPSNYLANLYASIPISITVEGANILTRNLIVFGQGMTRCHPYLLKIVDTLKKKEFAEFDETMMQYLAFVMSNKVRSFVRGITCQVLGRLNQTPRKRYERHLNRLSANLALLTDAMLALYGGRLKIRENLSARLGDMLTNLYIAASILHRLAPDADVDEVRLASFAINACIRENEQKMLELTAQLPWYTRLPLRFLLFPLGKCMGQVQDKQQFRIARAVTQDTPLRAKITSHILKEPLPNNPAGKLEVLFETIGKNKSMWNKLNKTVLDSRIEKFTLTDQDLQADFTKAERVEILKMIDALKDIISVDEFTSDQL